MTLFLNRNQNYFYQKGVSKEGDSVYQNNHRVTHKLSFTTKFGGKACIFYEVSVDVIWWILQNSKKFERLLEKKHLEFQI